MKPDLKNPDSKPTYADVVGRDLDPQTALFRAKFSTTGPFKDHQISQKGVTFVI